MANTSILIREYIWFEGKPVAVVEGGVVYFVRSDHIGRPDGTGATVWEASYLPFGGVHTSSGSPIALRFPGQWFQSESGLHQNWMRDYDPTTGRYMQADPLGLVDGASVYGYVGQNPGRYVDFFGLQSDVANPGWGGIDIGDIVVGGVRIGGRLIGGTIGLILTPTKLGDGTLVIPKTGEMCHEGCKPCRSASTNQIVPLNAPGHRYSPGSRGHYPYADGEHVHLYKAQQNPNNCQCFWSPAQKLPVSPPPPPGSLDITQHPLIGGQ